MMKLEIKLRPEFYIKKRAEKQKRGKRIDINDVGHIILFLSAFLGIWQLVFSLGIFPKVSLPSPAMVAQSFLELITDFSLITSISMTMWRFLFGFLFFFFFGFC